MVKHMRDRFWWSFPFPLCEFRVGTRRGEAQNAQTDGQEIIADEV
jgi:hypothetical protein